eukprot:12412929-Karenia_brevis.AAC.1
MDLFEGWGKIGEVSSENRLVLWTAPGQPEPESKEPEKKPEEKPEEELEEKSEGKSSKADEEEYDELGLPRCFGGRPEVSGSESLFDISPLMPAASTPPPPLPLPDTACRRVLQPHNSSASDG